MRLFLTILISILAISCQQREEKLLKRIYGLHQTADTAVSATQHKYLLEARYLLLNSKVGDDSIRIDNFNRLGLYYRKRGIIDSAANQFYNAISLTGENTQQRLDSLFYSGWEAYYTLKNYGDCLTICDKYAPLIKSSDHQQVASLYYMKENTFKGLRQYDSAFFYNKKRLEALARTEDEISTFPAKISRAQYLYYDFGDSEGTFAILDSIEASSVEKIPELGRQLYGNYGVFLYYEDRKQEALKYYIKGLEAAKKTPDSPDKITLLAYPYANIAEVLIDLERYEEAEKYLDSAVALGFANIDRGVQSSLLKYTYNLNRLTENESKEVMRLLDSVIYALDDQYTQKFTNELKALNEASRTEQDLIQRNTATQIENLQLQTRILITVVIALVLLTIGFWYLRYRNTKFQRTQLQLQQRLLRTQMNPHYTSNSLYAIGRLIKKSPEQASNLLTKFSRQLRQVMENSLKNRVLFEDEMTALKGYLELQKLRLTRGLEYKINYENFQEDDPIYIPPMLIQPFVENAIEHGFKDIDYLGRIELQLCREQKILKCTIADNGKGLSEGKFETRENSSIGLIREFLLKTTKSDIVVESGDEESGTRISIQIPYSTTDDH
ncbi:histidine kinase [Gilvibacter sediminis]|uniref:histidine kinase n=1 Tax=Gilvibacter sediminis TaxID=379071 RepID=UPI00234FE5F1|nr:histidine kinase [Gilvibacter sediminis]MDC7997408.1 histidine kinase [Gilvibacter sediminis]